MQSPRPRVSRMAHARDAVERWTKHRLDNVF